MIECQDVSFSYPASTLPDSERQAGGALKHISCTIEDGSFVLLCGTSGCGKTTMTRLFNGLIPHYHEGTYTGSVYLDGKDTRDLSLFDISLKVGSVFQNPRSQFFNVDTTSELAFGPENHGIAEDLVRDRVKRVAAQLKLEPLLDRSIFSLSGGEKQKIACGSAAAIDPDIYVLDEPSSNLDAYAIADFRQLLFTLKSQGKTIIISEHRLYYLSGLFDRVLYLKDGEIEGDYTAEEFCGLSARQRDDMGLRPLDLAGLSEVVGTPQRMNEAVWTIKNVSFAYKHEPETLHITETSFPSGSATAIIGHNGAGKSTFARCLCGLEKHFKGTVQDQSKNYSRKERLKLCYMVMQDVNHQLFTEDVLDELLLSMGGEDEKADTARAKEILNSLDLLDKVKLHPMSLSGGEKSRLVLAELFKSCPNFFVLDEPTNHMDIPAKETLESAFRAYTGTLLFVSHDRYFIRQVAESLLIFDDQSVFYYPFGYEHYLAHRNPGSGEELAASLRAEEQALLSGLQSVPMPERHRLKEYSTEQSYEDWQLRLLTEPMEQTRMELEQFWNTRDEIQEWTDPAYAEECLAQETILTDAYTKCCLAWYDKWAEFHPEPDKETGLLPS